MDVKIHVLVCIIAVVCGGNALHLDQICTRSMGNILRCEWTEEGVYTTQLDDSVEKVDFLGRFQNSVLNALNLPKLNQIVFEGSPFDKLQPCEHVIYQHRDVTVYIDGKPHLCEPVVYLTSQPTTRKTSKPSKVVQKMETTLTAETSKIAQDPHISAHPSPPQSTLKPQPVYPTESEEPLPYTESLIIIITIAFSILLLAFLIYGVYRLYCHCWKIRRSRQQRQQLPVRLSSLYQTPSAASSSSEEQFSVKMD